MASSIIRLLILGIIAGVMLSACSADSQTTRLDASNSGEQISVNTGDRIEIVLASNPSTGYSWVVDQGTTDVVALLSTAFEAGGGDLVGGGGTETLVFEAPAPGAGIIRLVYIRPFDDPPIPDTVVEYIVSVDGVPWDREATEPPSTSTATAPDPGDSAVEAIGVGALFDGEGARDATVEGFLLIDSSSARLCEALMESYPPQCGGLSIVVANPDGLDPGIFSEEQGIRWTDGVVALTGRFDGDRFVLDVDADTITPTIEDHALVAAFFDHAVNPTDATVQALPLADEVALGLGPDIITVRPRAELVDAANWSLNVEGYAGFAGPFSALQIAEQNSTEPPSITIGAHPHCAGPPQPAPTGFEDLRRVSIQSQTATSCIEWWTVDFFVDDHDVVLAITMDLFGP